MRDFPAVGVMRKLGAFGPCTKSLRDRALVASVALNKDLLRGF